MSEFTNPNDPPFLPPPPTTPPPPPLAPPPPLYPPVAPNAAPAIPSAQPGLMARLGALSTKVKVIGAVVALFLVCCTCAGIVGAAQNLAHGGSIVAATPTDVPTATPKPTATPDPNAGYQAYASLVASDLSILQPYMSQTGTDCGNQDFASCRADLQNVHDASVAFLIDLDQHPAPPCFKTTDGYLRSALADFRDGSTQAMNGIDALDASQIDAGSATVQQGSDLLTQATAAVKAAHC